MNNADTERYAALKSNSSVLGECVCVYELSWEQNMGNGRGIRMTVRMDDPETGEHVWRRCCKNRGLANVRDVKATCNGVEFNPVGQWPRPVMVQA